MSINEAFALFHERNPNVELKISKFQELRPIEVDISRNLPHNVCLCKIHENMKFLLDALCPHVGIPRLSGSSDEFISALTCAVPQKECFSLKCADCCLNIDGYDPKYARLESKKETVSQWGTVDGILTIKAQSMTLAEIFAAVKGSLKGFLVHVYVKRHQSHTFEEKKKRVDGHHIVMQVDFAQNMEIKLQNEVQSAHWRHKAATLFTSHAWFGPIEEEPHVIISNDLMHDKVAVHAFMDHLFEHISQTRDDVKFVDVFSDNCAAQFKQKYILSLLHVYELKYGFHITWHFFAAGHGKGVVDGHGGTVKSAVWRRLLSGKVLRNAKEVADLAAKICPNIRVSYVSAEKVRENEEALNDHFEATNTFPGTQRFHWFRPQPGGPAYAMEAKEESDAQEIARFIIRND
ncbi:hypothetical protein FOCC_FOCC016693 [Frankliniella occidentalis]|nr:hypothetical protein FOCC_FOCC016693 [Frankliniella occidentalis]